MAKLLPKSHSWEKDRSQALSEVIDSVARAIDRAVDSEDGVKGIYAAALAGLQRALGIERASILLFDPDGVMRFKAWLGISDSYREAAEGHTPWPLETREPQPLIVEDVRKDPSLTSLLLALSRENVRALAFIPLTYRGKLLGKFMLYSRHPYRFENEVGFALTLGKLIAFGIVRNQTEADLRASEEQERRSLRKYQELVDSIEGIVWEAKPDLQFVFVSKRAERILGYPMEQWTNVPAFWAEHIHPDDREWALKFCNDRSASQQDHGFEYRMIAADGRIVWLRDLVHVVVEDGRFVGLKGIMVDITEEKRAEERLRDSEERFRGIFEQSPFSIQLLTEEGRIFAVNPAGRRLWKIPEVAIEVLKSKYNVRRDPQLIEKGVMPHIEKAFQGTPSVMPAILYDPVRSGMEGIARWVEGYAYPVKDGRGRLREVVLMHNDITDRKRAENQLRESEARFRQIVETAEEGVWLIDRDAKTIVVNHKMAQILGYSPEEMIGRDLWYFLDEEGRRISKVNLERRRSGIREHHEFRLLKKDGSEVWTLMATSPVYDSQGGYDGALAMVTDITAEKRATEKLKELSGRLSALTTSISDYLWSAEIDQNGRFLYKYYSPVVEKVTGRPIEYYLAGPDRWLSTVHVEDRPRMEAILQRILLRQTDHEEADYRIVLPDGSVRWVRDSVIVRQIRGGGIRIDGVVSDVTERKLYLEARERQLAQETRTRKEAEKAIELRDDFLSIATHELRTPLTPLRMYFQLIKQQVEALELEPAKAELLDKALKGAEREFERFLKLVENLLDVTRIRAGRIILDRRETDLSELVRNVAVRFEADLKKAKCELRLDIQDHVIGNWDQSRIEQVVTNLLANATKYGAQRPIEVAVFKTSSKALIRIKDYGIGISNEDQEKVFQRFERVAPIRHFAGFGLGLFISKEIVKAHGGIIRLESEPGRGSIFTVEIPI